jgi:hypothetical protein
VPKPLAMQTLILLVLLLLGTVVCTGLAGAVTLRWRLPWREALIYFGLASHPQDTARDATRQPG